jgi:hypothetical protein
MQVAAWLVLVQVKNKRERSLPVRPPGVEKTSRLRSRDPVARGSSAGRMVAWTVRWSRGRFLGWATKPRSSRDYVGVVSWVEIGGGYTEFAGFPVVHQKTTGFFGWSTKPRPKNRRRCCSSARPVWPVGLTGLTGGYRSDRWEHQSDRCATMQSRIFEAEDTRRDRKACVKAKQVAVAGHPSDGESLYP